MKNKKENTIGKYDYNGKISEGMTLVGNYFDKTLLYGFINIDKDLVIPCIYSVAWDFKKGISRVKSKSGKWGYIDKKGNELIPIIYNHIQAVNNGYVFVCLNGKWGGIDLKSMNIVIPIQYDWLFPWKDELAIFRLENKYGVINKSGIELIPASYDYIKPFSEGLAASKLNGKWGFIDINNQWVIPPMYEKAWSFNNVSAQVIINSNYHKIDKLGNLLKDK